MIEYEADPSPFYTANKNYCETLAHILKTVNLECSGWCNSFGYELETHLKKDDLTYHIKFLKNQTTQNGVVIPVNAHVYEGTVVTVKGLNKKFCITAGISPLRRLFMSKKNKNKISVPYFLKFNDLPEDAVEAGVVKKILDNKITKLRLNNGTLVCKIHTATTDPLGLIRDIETMTQNWA